MGNLGSRKPNLMFVFNKNRLKPRFLGLKKYCMSQDSNLGPKHSNSKNRPVVFCDTFSYFSLYNLIDEAVSFRMVPWKLFSDNGKVV